MADLEASRPTTPHPGVDAQSWLGFEQRIQARRFEALLASARQAIASGNVVLAEHALLEAREIRPNAEALRDLEAELRALLPNGQGAVLLRRAIGALALLAAGVSMFVGLDALRIPRDALQILAPPPPRPLLRAVATARSLEIPLTLPATPAVSESLTLAVATGVPSAVPPRRTSDVFSPPLSSAARQSTVLAAQPRSTALEPPPYSRAPASLATHTNAAEESLGARPTLVAVPAPTAVSSVPTAAIEPARLDTATEDSARVADVLRRYARAYGDLDVGAARDVWPGVDERALARAFGSLASQSVSFEDCQIAVHGATANASCRGQASYVGKVGRGAPRIEPRTWRFELRRDGETWKIENAEARRTSG